MSFPKYGMRLFYIIKPVSLYTCILLNKSITITNFDQFRLITNKTKVFFNLQHSEMQVAFKKSLL